MAGYLMVVPVLLWWVGLWLRNGARRRAERLIASVNSLFIAIAVLTLGANVFLYEEWKTLLNNRALKYMSTPSALLNSMSPVFMLVSLGLFMAGVWLFVRLYRLWVGREVLPDRLSLRQYWTFPLVTGLLVLFIRGNGVMPINESAVYYSTHPFYNHAATNAGWYLAHSFLEARAPRNNYTATDIQEARRMTQVLYTPPPADTSTWIQPSDTALNVVMVIMESMTAQVIESLGGEKDVCPNIERLIAEGVLFTHCYAGGYRTDQGIISVLAGYPAQPDQSIILLSDKAATLNSVPAVLKAQKGYQTAFVYGGELTFANMGVWLAHQRFDRLVSEKDFSAADRTQRWGVDDVRALQRYLTEINGLRPPFCAAALTLSLHPPFDVPWQSRWQGTSERGKFLHSASFADHALGAFMEAAAHQPWYRNTLFVIVADHGSAQPGGLGLDQPRSRQVPLILYSPRLHPSKKGTRIAQCGNYHDLPAILMPLLGVNDLPAGTFPWSRNLLLPGSRDLAVYTNENGLGWVRPEGAGFYRFQERQWQFWGDTLSREQQDTARAWLQALYHDFLER